MSLVSFCCGSNPAVQQFSTALWATCGAITFGAGATVAFLANEAFNESRACFQTVDPDLCRFTVRQNFLDDAELLVGFLGITYVAAIALDCMAPSITRAFFAHRATI